MFPQEFLDALTVVLMFGLRVGLPLAFTLAFGYWLEKKLAPSQEQEQTQEQKPVLRIIKSGNVIQLHCWDLKRNSETAQAKMSADHHPELPCWLALQADGQKVREECFTCALYKPQSMVA